MGILTMDGTVLVAVVAAPLIERQEHALDICEARNLLRSGGTTTEQAAAAGGTERLKPTVIGYVVLVVVLVLVVTSVR